MPYLPQMYAYLQLLVLRAHNQNVWNDRLCKLLKQWQLLSVLYLISNFILNLLQNYEQLREHRDIIDLCIATNEFKGNIITCNRLDIFSRIYTMII